MDKPFLEKLKKDLMETVKTINLCWLEGRPENLAEYFHKEMMIVSPELKILGRGRDECIKSYTDFTSRCTITRYHESKPDVHIFENTAVVSYKYDIAWKTKEKTYREPGQDLFVFTHTGNRWLAVWRKIIPAEK